MERNYGYNRSSSYVNRYSSKKSRNGKGFGKFDRNTMETIANQLIVCAFISLVVIIISNFNSPFILRMLNGVKWVVGVDYDFKTAAVSIKNFVDGNPESNEKTATTEDILKEKNEAVDVSSRNTFAFIMPVNGIITSKFGTREDPITHKTAEHYGIDIGADKGTPIKVVSDGIVLKVEQSKTLGKSVTVRHSSGIETLYGHCSEILIEENQKVKQGDIIARVGDTGEVTSAHLHLEVYKDGKQIDPLTIIDVSKLSQ